MSIDTASKKGVQDGQICVKYLFDINKENKHKAKTAKIKAKKYN